MPLHRVTRLRNRMSHVLFEHKESIGSNAYKILYETLQDETKNEPAEMVWVTMTYAKAGLREECDGWHPDITMHARNIRISPSMFEAAKKSLDERHPPHCTFYHIIPDDTIRQPKQYLARELDEPDLFGDENDTNAFKLLSVKLLE